MNEEKYLGRFNAQKEEPSLTHLSMLQNLHLEQIPFENLDVINRIPIYLNLSLIYDKIVNHHRGGYCYELNGLFQALLEGLGYSSHLVAATVLRPSGEWAKADTHAAILVYLDEPYLVDVGFGANTPRIPIPLSGAPRNDVSAAYKVQQHSKDVFDLIRYTGVKEQTLYRFKTTKRDLVDFHEGCVFNQVSEESTFTHKDIVTRATSTGRVTLIDRTLTKYGKGEPKKTLLSATEKINVLQDVFKIGLQKEE